MESEKSLTVNDTLREGVELIRRTVAQGATDDELAMFMHQAKRTGLDPLARQIYMIIRNQWDKELKRSVPKATIQVSIDGFRLVADRTGEYAPGEEKFDYDENKHLIAAHVSVKKLVSSVWHEVWASAYWDEYAQTYEDKQGKVVTATMWKKMPRTMLAKCAEAKALRKAFPSQLSGLYTADEMAQADSDSQKETKQIAAKTEPMQPALDHENQANEPWVDEKGGVLIEGEPSKQETLYQEKLNENERKVFDEICEVLVNLCGANAKDMQDTLEMASEWRDEYSGKIKKAGGREPKELSYAFNPRATSGKSQAEFALDCLKTWNSEMVKELLTKWRGLKVRKSR